MNNKTTPAFRLTLKLKWILVFDLAFALTGLAVSFMFPVIQQQALWVFSVFILAMFAHALIIPFKGGEFALEDAPPNSMVTYYILFAFIACIAGAGFLVDMLLVYL